MAITTTDAMQNIIDNIIAASPKIQGNDFQDLFNIGLKKYRVGTFSFTQATTAAPTLPTVYQNTLNGTTTPTTPTMARTSAGVYTMTLTGKMGSAATKLFAQRFSYIDTANVSTVIKFTWTSANVITITTTTNAGVAKDALVTALPIEIRIYE